MTFRRLLVAVTGTLALLFTTTPATQATMLPVVDGELFGVATISPDDAWAVGWQRDPDVGTEVTLTEHWDGTGWNIVPSPSPDTSGGPLLDVAAVSTSDVWSIGLAGTGPFAEHWDGARWSITSLPVPDTADRYSIWLTSVAAASSEDVWAVGSYLDASDRLHMLIEHWDGSAWSVVPGESRPRARQQLFSVSASSAGNAWVVGISDLAPLIESWDGAAWHRVPAGTGDEPNVVLQAVAAVSRSDVWAVGRSGADPSGFFEHWNGSRWRIVPAPADVARAGFPTDVAAVTANDVWAIGPAHSGPEGVIEHWDGSAWRLDAALQLPTEYAGLAGVSAVHHAAWAVGSYYDPVGEVLRPIVAEHHQRSWQLLGSQAPVFDTAALRVTTSVRQAHVGDRVTFEAYATNVENHRANVWVSYRDPQSFTVRSEICVDGPSADTPSCEFSYIPAHDTVVVKVGGRVRGTSDEARLTFCTILADRPVTSCKTGVIKIVR